MEAPLVSVVMPAYNYERYIAAALESVAAQDYEPIETIVVDDGSSDRSAEIARQHGVRIIATEHGGIARARNLGVAAARGDLIAFLDADDIWTDGSLSVRVGYLEQHPEIDFVFGAMLGFLDPDSPPPAWFPPRLVTEPSGGAIQTFVVRREVFARTGPFDETLVVGEDLDWIARAHDAGCRGTLLDSVYVLRRFHSGSTTTRNLHIQRETLKRVVKRSIDRKHTARSERPRPRGRPPV